MPQTKILAHGPLSLAALAGPEIVPVPVADATALPPEHWTYRKAAPGVLEIGVPILPATWSELGIPPAAVELRVFDVSLPAEIDLATLDQLVPVARVEAAPPEKPGVVPFGVEGLVGGAAYSAVVLGHWAD